MEEREQRIKDGLATPTRPPRTSTKLKDKINEAHHELDAIDIVQADLRTRADTIACNRAIS
jgi:hypothetical protein